MQSATDIVPKHVTHPIPNKIISLDSQHDLNNLEQPHGASSFAPLECAPFHLRSQVRRMLDAKKLVVLVEALLKRIPVESRCELALPCYVRAK